MSSVWKVELEEGSAVKKGDVAVILEAMKMEMQVLVPSDCTIEKILVKPGTMVKPGQELLIIRKS